MTVTIRKAGEAAAKNAKRVLRPPRAVTAAEAPEITPPRESNHVTMMPWRGWFQRWLKETIGPERFATFRNIFFFAPDDEADLWQAPIAATKFKLNDKTTAEYRYPAPGSQSPARVPELVEPGDDPYDTAYFKYDTKNRYINSEVNNPKLEIQKLLLMDQNDPLVQEELEKLKTRPRESSPGNQGRFATGPTDFDPTGLRATMSVTWEETEKVLDENMPDHLPTPVWVGREKEVTEWYESRGLPVPVGEYYKPLKTPLARRVASLYAIVHEVESGKV
jgi:hypothetical protein